MSIKTDAFLVVKELQQKMELSLINDDDVHTQTVLQPHPIEVDQHSSMRKLIMGNVLFRFCFQLEGKNQRPLSSIISHYY